MSLPSLTQKALYTSQLKKGGELVSFALLSPFAGNFCSRPAVSAQARSLSGQTQGNCNYLLEEEESRKKGKVKKENKNMAHQMPTEREYYDNMWKLHSQATLISHLQTEDGRQAMVLDSTIFHPQGGGQPSDVGDITIPDSSFKFMVKDVRSKDDIIYHYGNVESSEEIQLEFRAESGTKVHLHVEESCRSLNSRLHTAGHVLDVAICNVGLGHFQPGKAYHFPDGERIPCKIPKLISFADCCDKPFVEYKGSILPTEVQTKLEELERDTNAQISRGAKVSASILPYEEAAKLCGGSLPDYIPKGSNPRIVRIGEHFGCPCGGTHVPDISDIRKMKVLKIRSKKGLTRVFYNIDD